MTSPLERALTDARVSGYERASIPKMKAKRNAAIIRAHRNGATYAEMAREHGVWPSTIKHVVSMYDKRSAKAARTGKLTVWQAMIDAALEEG
jgi:transposase-like protein